MFPREGIEDVHEIIDSLIEYVQWVCVEKFCWLSLDCFSVVVDLEVAFTEIHMRLVLMPPDHEVPFRFDPLDPVKIVRVGLWEIEGDVQLRFSDWIGRIEKCLRCQCRSNTGFVPCRRVIPDALNGRRCF
ncbi:hypothetical protein [Halorubrum vacuolatum]|uniref:hypothetical protein n=1 Tax=Halorubrum vacuolatum TaxID=63740 RepID=UPI0015C5D0DD|nr:hypothetical protein [Halorubrum vacuolatum]